MSAGRVEGATATHLKETITRFTRPEPPKGPEMFHIGLEAGHAKRLNSLDEAVREEQYKKQNKMAEAGHAVATTLSGISKGYAHDVASASAAAASSFLDAKSAVPPPPPIQFATPEIHPSPVPIDDDKEMSDPAQPMEIEKRGVKSKGGGVDSSSGKVAKTDIVPMDTREATKRGKEPSEKEAVKKSRASHQETPKKTPAIVDMRGTSPAPPSLPAPPKASSAAAAALPAPPKAAASSSSSAAAAALPAPPTTGFKLTTKQYDVLTRYEKPSMTDRRHKFNDDILHMPESYWKGFTRQGLKEIGEVVFGARYSDLETKNTMVRKDGKMIKQKGMKKEDYLKDVLARIRKARESI